MNEITFLLANKDRRKFFFKCILIGFPLLMIGALLINYIEDSSAAKGTPNDKGGMDYYFRNSVTEKAPEVFSKLTPLYPGSKLVYYNFSTDKANNMAGNLDFFTPDSFEKVKAFYKGKGKILDEDDDLFVFDVDGQKIRLSTEKTQEDDPVQGENKINIYLDSQ